jgi:hypothetical protein
MDMSNVTRSMWIVIGGTVGALLGTLILDWWKITIDVGPLGSVSGSASAWDISAFGKLAVLGSLLLLAGVVLMFVPNPPELPVPLPMATLIVAAFTAVMALLFFLMHISRSDFGNWLTIVSGAVAAYGAYEMGGRFSMSSTSS